MHVCMFVCIYTHIHAYIQTYIRVCTCCGGGTEAALEVAAVDCRDPAAGPSGRRSGECGESDVRVTAAGSESFVRDIVCERVREAR